jgi:hypothetical protein
MAGYQLTDVVPPEDLDAIQTTALGKILDATRAPKPKTLLVHIDYDAWAGLLYLKGEWGIESYVKTIECALLHTMNDTKDGLTKLKLTVDDRAKIE